MARFDAARRSCAAARSTSARIRRAAARRPRNRNLDGVDARVDLSSEIGDRRLDEPIDQRLKELGIAIGEQTRGRLVGRSPCRRPCSSPPSRARRKSREARHSSGRPRLDLRSIASNTGARPAEIDFAAQATTERCRAVDRLKRGPSPSSKETLWPSASGITRMSLNRIAASKPKRRIGCKVASTGKARRVAEIEKGSRLARGSRDIPGESARPAASARSAATALDWRLNARSMGVLIASPVVSRYSIN